MAEFKLIIVAILIAINKTNSTDSRITNFTTNIFKDIFAEEQINCFYFTSDHNSLDEYVIESLTNLQGLLVVESIQRRNNQKFHCNGYIIISNNYSTIKNYFTQKRNTNETFLAHSKILIFTEDSKNDFKDDVFLDTILKRNIEIFLVEYQYFCGIWNICVIENLSLFSFINNELTFKINFTNKNSVEKNNKKLIRMRNKTVKIKVGTYECPPFVYFNSEGVLFDGLEYIIFKEIMKGWTVDFVQYKKNENLFSSIKRDVENKITDASFGALWDTDSVRYNVDISFPYSQACATFLVHKPIFLQSSKFLFQSMTPIVWGTISIVIVLFGAIFSLIEDVYNRKPKDFDYTVGILYCINILTAKSIRFPPASQVLYRWVITFWAIISLLIATIYSAGLNSSLTKPKLTEIINTMENMLQYDIHWMAPDKDTAKFYNQSNNKHLKQLVNYFLFENNTLKRNTNFRTRKYGVKVQLTQNTFLDIENLDDYGQINLQLISECAGTYFVVFIFQKNSVFTRYFSERVQTFLEHGIIMSWAKQIALKTDYVDIDPFLYHSPKIPSNTPLNMRKIKGIFYLILFGNMCGLIVFVLECLVYNFFRKPIDVKKDVNIN